MARFSGLVGYTEQKETSPGVWKNVENPRKMVGDIISQSSVLRGGDQIHEDVSLNHRISVVGDAYAFDNYFNIRWVQVDGHKWQVTGVEVTRPRLIFSLGGMWNG